MADHGQYYPLSIRKTSLENRTWRSIGEIAADIVRARAAEADDRDAKPADSEADA